MDELSVTEKSFVRRPMELPPLEDGAQAAGETLSLELEFEPYCAYRVYDEFHQSLSLSGRKRGRLRVEIDFPAGSWVLGYLLSFGDRGLVLSPRNFKQS